MQQLVQLTPRVWVMPADPDPAEVRPVVGVISTATRTILVDAGNGDRHARQLAAALRDIGAPPVRAVIYTHHHWDHVFGAYLFDVPVVAHEQTRDLLVQEAAKPWGLAYLDDEVAREPLLATSYSAIGQAIEDWDTFAVRVPTVTFSQRMRLYIDDMRIELEHVGGQHAADAIVVRVPEQRVLFLGDCFYPPPLHQRPPDAVPDRAMLANFAADDTADIYVHGHGPWASTAELRTFLARLEPPNTGSVE